MYVAVYVKKGLRKRLMEIAEKKNKTLSALVREWMEEKIKEETE